MESLLAIFLGLGLSAACGFRIFVPLLVMSIAAQAGHLELAPDLQWIGSEVALLVFVVATFFEVSAYYVPWVDNLLDVVATPVAVVAGILVMSAAMGDIGDLSPMWRWALAAILGGGAAGITQGTTECAAIGLYHHHRGAGQPAVGHRRKRHFSAAGGGGGAVDGLARALAGQTGVETGVPQQKCRSQVSGIPADGCSTLEKVLTGWFCHAASLAPEALPSGSRISQAG